MNRAIMDLDSSSLDTIHAYSLEVLQDIGIRFPSEKALALFKRHGLRVDGSMVRFEEKHIQKKLYENVSLLIIDDSFSKDRVTLFKNKNYQLAPLNTLLRERSESSIPKHTLIISDTPVGNISSSGFGKDIEYLICTRGSVLTFENASINPVIFL